MQVNSAIIGLSSYFLLVFLPQPSCCQQPLHCRWGPYGEWSECDACTNTMARTRQVVVYAQFGGSPCSGEAAEVVSCVSQKRCPLQTGCGDRFRCTSGQCINQSLVCNGDNDCEDGLDERNCDLGSSQDVCDTDKTPPNTNFTGRGYDVLTGKLKAGVINTLSFGGQCRKVFSGDHKILFRLPQSILRYNFEVRVDNEESDESFESSWSYMLHIQNNAWFGHDRRTFHKELSDNKAKKLLILKNQVELAQFQNSAPQYLTLSEGFWKSLSSLPITYDYSAYRRLLQMYGTHYMSEGSLGGQYQTLLEFDRQSLESTSTTDTDYQRCWRKVKRRLLMKKVKSVCEKLTSSLKSSYGKNTTKLRFKTNVIGGNPAFISDLGVLDVEDPGSNAAVYDRWASSVKDFPDVINQKLRPLYELVKEIQCAALKKLHLKTATEEFLAEEHPCHCRPCQNNGQPLLSGTECTCVCRPGTSGLACETGSVIGQQPGVIHGNWSCWTSWGSCSGGQRSRTRSCNNPTPSGGGLLCSGQGVERKTCEDPDVQYLQTIEPQCFGLSVRPLKPCSAPPNLNNGYVLNPKDAYAVGNRIEYRCVHGYYLIGEAEADCTGNQTWRTGWKECRRATCHAPVLRNGVIGTPSKVAYEIGDRVFLSCPQGSALQAEESEIMCSPGLQWSPFPNAMRCTQVPKPTTPPRSDLNCKLWETMGKSQCVCKMPFQCPPSLQLCAKLGSSQTHVLSLCQLGALRCLGRSFSLANDSDCSLPADTLTSCPNCHPWEICHEGKCKCQQHAECSGDSAHMCVTHGDSSVAVTMSECEVGARRCAGEQLTVIGIDECQN